MLQIGKHQLKSRVLLAPMAGITDVPMRKICREHGAALTTSEMLTSDTRFWTSHKSSTRLAEDDDAIRSIQIAGSDPEQMADAAAQCQALGVDIIDINMGCPVKKVCKKLAGSALLQDEPLVTKILESVCAAVTIPVTLKTRTGWSEDQRNGLRIAQIAEQAGVQALAVHGRTRACRFNGDAEYNTIRTIVDAVKIPVFANGDISSAHKAYEVLRHTGAAGVLIGRAAFGNPWIFKQCNQFLENGEILKGPSLTERKQLVLTHVKALHQFYGEFKGVLLARKHFSWYIQGLQNYEATRKHFNSINCPQEQLKLIFDYFYWLHTIEEKAA
ncbi:MAG: tRNA-dihydrouridine synthase B [Flavobacteriales bacterium]